MVLAIALAASAAARAGAAASGDDAQPSEAPEVRRAPGAHVTGVLPAELPADPSAATTVVELRDYQGEAKTTADLLGDTVGVQVRRFGGPGNPSELSIRGSTASQVVVLLDGVRLNSAQSGTVDLSTIPAELIDRIEVTRGAGGVQEGGGAIGGVVNVVTRRPGAKPSTRAVGSAGSFGTWAATLSHTQRTPWVDVVAGYDFFKTSGDWTFQRPIFVNSAGQVSSQEPTELTRVNNRAESHAGLLKVGRDLGPGARLELGEDFFYQSRGVPGLDTGPGPVGGQSTTAHERLLRNVADLRLALPGLGDGMLDGELRGFYRLQRQRFTEPMPSFGPPVDVDDRNHAAGLRGGLEGGGAALGASHWLRLDGEVRDEWLVRREAFHPERSVAGAALQDEIRTWDDRLAVIPALRLDWTQGFAVEPLPRLGLLLEPLPWLRLRANAERSYRAPGFDELYQPDLGFLRGNPALDPEESWNVDAGFVVGFARLGALGAVRLDATYFWNDIRNSIVFTQISPFTIAPVNTNDARVQGVELALSVAPWSWVELAGNYTWLDTRVARTGAPLPGRPEHEAYGRVRLGPPSGLVKLVGGIRYVSDIPVSLSGRQVVSARTTVDASIAVDPAQLVPWTRWWLPRNAVLSLTGTNLTDQSVRDSLGFPQPGRWLTLQIEGRW